MHQAELLIVGLLIAVAGLSALARWLSIPYPIVLVIGGALFGVVPGPLVSAAEGEGLFNDATALVAYRVAVAAVVAGSFSMADAGLRFLAGAIGGVAIGLLVGWSIAAIRKRTEDAQVSITISLL